MILQKTQLGYEIRTPEVTIFFGGKNSQISNLKTAYPDLDFTRVKQIHSDAVVESKDSVLDLQVIADAHYSTAQDLALCVITADCVPALLYHRPSKLIAGVHAGWRGVANRILIKTIELLNEKGVPAHELDVIIGPHIQKKSFEVGLDVRDQILTSLSGLTESQKSELAERISEHKSLVDLNQVVKAQLSSVGVDSQRVFDLHIDTFTNQDFHSYRRDHENAGRQISFICRTS